MANMIVNGGGQSRRCPVCGAPVRRSGQRYCSRACYNRSRSHTRVCAVCGREFAAPPSSDKVCCSRACSSARRRDKHANGDYDRAIQAALRQAHANPRMQRGPDNLSAKAWAIRSPDGHVYECRNLLHWCREHADLLDATPRQAWDGIAKIKYSMQGKRKHPCYSWHGWTLVSYGD